jgi:hypothetical protein
MWTPKSAPKNKQYADTPSNSKKGWGWSKSTTSRVVAQIIWNL